MQVGFIRRWLEIEQEGPKITARFALHHKHRHRCCDMRETPDHIRVKDITRSYGNMPIQTLHTPSLRVPNAFGEH